MEEAFLRFEHLPEQILEKLDNKSLAESRIVNALWKNFIDGKDYPLIRFMKKNIEEKQKRREREERRARERERFHHARSQA